MFNALDFVKPQFETFDELVDSCATFYEQNIDQLRNNRIHKTRVALSKYIEDFHRECGILTPDVQKKIDDFRCKDCVLVMSAHQPNLFPYSGVMRKATMIFVLAKELEKRLKVPVINFFGIADQDFTDDRWVKTSLLPAVLRRDGLFSIHVKLPEKVMLNKLPKPSMILLDDWADQIECWLDDAIGSVERLSDTCGLPSFISKKNLLRGNFKRFWKIVEKSHNASHSYSDFNAFVMSKIVNDVWGYNTLFSRFSDCQQIFAEEINFLLSKYDEYSDALAKAHELLVSQGVSSGVSIAESLLIPFWYHCDCGSKVRLFSSYRNGSLFGSGTCRCCNKFYELNFGNLMKPDVSVVASRISLRAISWILTFSKGLGFSCYVGGAGGLSYIMEVQHVAKKLGLPLPPIPVWRPNDDYVGIGQLEASLMFKKMCDEWGVCNLSDAENILKSRIDEAQLCLDNLETSKNVIMEKLNDNPDNEELRAEFKQFSSRKTEVKRSSNLSVLYNKLNVLSNISTVHTLIPSIVDYAVNVGLKETSDQWVSYLTKNGKLCSDVPVKSVLI